MTLAAPRQSPETPARDAAAKTSSRQLMTYLPASRFWPVQYIESGIFAVLAFALVTFTFWWVTTREV